MKIIHITANSRLSASLKQQAIQQQTHAVIQTPNIMTLGQWWLQWQEGCLLRGELGGELLADQNFVPARGTRAGGAANKKTPKLTDKSVEKVLGGFEAQWLWEQVLQQELDDREKARESESDSANEQVQSIALLNVSSTAKQLYQAWTLSQEWFTEADSEEHWLESAYLSNESLLYKKCQVRYVKALETNHWTDEVFVQQQRLEWLQQGKGQLPDQFKLHGFDEITPHIQQWQSAVEARGCLVEIEAPVAIEQNADQLSYAALDPQDEVEQVALWAVDQWQQISQSKPAHEIKIAIVSPSLADYKVPLVQCLEEQLTLNGLQKMAMSRSQPPFYNLSLGTSLLELPLVQNAWLSLQLFLRPSKPCSYADWSQWLISPYTSGDLVKRQKADSAFRRMQWSNFAWPTLVESEKASFLPKELKKRLVKQADRKISSKLSLEAFIAEVWALLKQLDWTGARTLNSDEYQQKSVFEKAITQFSLVTDMAGKQSVSAWLSLFKRFLAEQLHQSQSKGLQPIQVMGMLEAGGQQFDALWVMGLTDEAWPRMANPNPFLPMNLQRERRSPRCDAKRELDYAKQVTARLAISAPTVVWSYAQQQGEAELLPSPLIPQQESSDYRVSDYPAIDYHSMADQIFKQRNEENPIEWVLDAKGPEVPEGSKAPGGTGILQAQSKCPLMAFLDFRLGGKYGLQTVEEGLQNNFQGTLVHEVLEHFWEEFKTQTAIMTLSDDVLKDHLNRHIKTSFDALAGTIEGAYLELEQKRILELCFNWLGLEKERPSFTVVATEARHEIELAGMQFSIIIDRVDKVAGESVIIDYKTGRASINSLLKTPIEAPQLAVYLHAVSDSVAGIGYGLLHADDGVKMSAVIADEDVMQKARTIQIFSKMAEKEGNAFYETTWTHFLDHLKQEVLELARQIQQGAAEMVFDSPADIQYASCQLALRLPEVAKQQQEYVMSDEEEE